MGATDTATVEFSLDRFEIVAAAPGIALLRVAGRWSNPGGAITLGTPELLVDDGNEAQRVELLPGPDHVVPAAGPGGVPWRGGFQLSPEVAENPSTSFSLDAGDGVVVELPRPTVRAEKPAPGRRLSGDGETGLRGLLDEQSRRRIEAERAAEVAQARVLELESQLAAAESEASTRLEDAQSAAQEKLDARVGELEEKRTQAESAAQRTEQRLNERISHLEAELTREREDRRKAESTLQAASADHEERAERQRIAETRCAAAAEARQVAEARAADAERALEAAQLAPAGHSS